MCLAVPFKIVEINGSKAIGEVEGIKREIRLDFISDIKVGEYVMVHAGFGIEKVDPIKAKQDLAAYKELEEALNG